jgi:hypothetical protein
LFKFPKNPIVVGEVEPILMIDNISENLNKTEYYKFELENVNDEYVIAVNLEIKLPIVDEFSTSR